MSEVESKPVSGEGAATGQSGSQKVTCFISKRQVERSQAQEVEHPKEGLVWVSEQFIK
jgi:hypothetical protein